jgi:hypothetical protein
VAAEEDQGGLFAAGELEALAASPGVIGRVERLLRVALTEAARNSLLIKEDLGLVGSALAGARALDAAERGGAKGGPYAVAALLTPYRETLQALRLPIALTPADGAAPMGGDGQSAVIQALSDEFGAAQ